MPGVRLQLAGPHRCKTHSSEIGDGAASRRPAGRVKPESIPVGVQGARSDPSGSPAVVVRYPGARVVGERDPRLGEVVAACHLGAEQRLQCACVAQRSCRAFSLLARVVVERDHVAVALLVDAGRRGSHELRGWSALARHCLPGCRSRLSHASGLTSCCRAPGGCSLAGASLVAAGSAALLMRFYRLRRRPTAASKPSPPGLDVVNAAASRYRRTFGLPSSRRTSSSHPWSDASGGCAST